MASIYDEIFNRALSNVATTNSGVSQNPLIQNYLQRFGQAGVFPGRANQPAPGVNTPPVDFSADRTPPMIGFGSQGGTDGGTSPANSAGGRQLTPQQQQLNQMLQAVNNRGSKSGGAQDTSIGDRSQSFANANKAMTPSFGNSVRLAMDVASGMKAPLELMIDAAMAGMGVRVPGIYSSPFNTPGPMMPQSATDMIANSTSSLPPNSPLVAQLSALNNALGSVRGGSMNTPGMVGATTGIGAYGTGRNPANPSLSVRAGPVGTMAAAQGRQSGGNQGGGGGSGGGSNAGAGSGGSHKGA